MLKQAGDRRSHSWEFLVPGCRPVIQILTLFQTKKCHFSHSFSDLTSKKICHHYLDWNTNKNDFLICTFLVLSYSFGIERINAFIYTPVVPSKNHTRLQTKMGKVSCFQTKTAQKPYLLGRHISIWLIYKRRPSPSLKLWTVSSHVLNSIVTLMHLQ